MVEETATNGGYLDLEIVEHELERWLAMHDAARSIFEGLPPDQQETIRRDGQPTIVPLTALVGCKPELRELASTILRRLHDDIATIRTSQVPLIVNPRVGGLSHPVGRMDAEPSDEKTGNGATVERDWQAEVDDLTGKVDRLEVMVRELLSVLGSPAGSESPVPPRAP